MRNAALLPQDRIKGIMKTTDSRPLAPPPYQLLRGSSLFLDLDGTLIEIAARPDAVSVDDGLIDLLKRLQRGLSDRVVIVSGRPASEVRSLLRGMRISISGSHGAEMQLASGVGRTAVPTLPPERIVEQLQQLAARYPGVIIETKPFGLAVHYRMAPGAARACEALVERIATAENFMIQRGKEVIELKFHARTKGDAVREFMDLAPMNEGRPLFIGDDLTDEAGFAAVVHAGGVGILIGSDRPTHASYSLPGVDAALRWLEKGLAGQP